MLLTSLILLYLLLSVPYSLRRLLGWRFASRFRGPVRVSVARRSRSGFGLCGKGWYRVAKLACAVRRVGSVRSFAPFAIRCLHESYCGHNVPSSVLSKESIADRLRWPSWSVLLFVCGPERRSFGAAEVSWAVASIVQGRRVIAEQLSSTVQEELAAKRLGGLAAGGAVRTLGELDTEIAKERRCSNRRRLRSH